ncbi:MAG: hypothetical protein AABW51_01020 [Nanoarchaeota archaeon]
MEKDEIIKEIMKKREFSQLPIKDVGVAYSIFERRQVGEEEKIRLTREFLHKIFGAFLSKKLLSLKDKDSDWILRKHLSTRERLPYYGELYNRIFKNFNEKNITIFDLGAGINGFSYNYFGHKVRYIGVEAVGQLVDLMNYHFKKEKLNASAIHESLFELEKIKKTISMQKGKKIVFLFKVLDALEEFEIDYSKKLLKEITPLVDMVVVSFATRSMMAKKKFKVNRNWIFDFIKQEFNVLDDFGLGGERYIVFGKQI